MALYNPQLKADYRRIIETRHNLNQPRTPDLIKYNEIIKGFQTDDLERTLGFAYGIARISPNDYVMAHQRNDANRHNQIKSFLNDQLRIDDWVKREQLRKTKYSRSDYYRLGGTDAYYKINGATLAKTISDVRNPPDVEQERKNLDYTLRACEYIKRIEQLDKVRDKLEPRIKQIDQEFNGGEWVHMNWNAIGITGEQFVALDYLFNLHRVHVSLMNPLQIAHYPTLKHLRDGREVVTKLGKYLTSFKDFIGITETEIKDAVEVYAHEKSVVRLAYIQSLAGDILARCIVREDVKQYVRIYPDANGSTEGKYLQQYLKANGYTHGNLDGCLLKMIEHKDEDDIFVAPYIDAGSDGNGASGSSQNGELVDIDGKTYIEINSHGDLCLSMTNGYTDDVEDDDESECDECGDMEHNDDMSSTYHDQYVCRHCIENNYEYAWVRANEQDYVHEDNVIFVGDEAYHENVDFSAFDIYNCEETGDLYHIDDLVMTLRGFIYCDLVETLDHEDADGNESAHQDDVHELSDGTTCHTDDAERIQAEIDAEAEDEPTQPTQPTEEIKQNENN